MNGSDLMQITINPNIEELSTASIAVDEALKKVKISDEDRVRTLLTLEEVLALLIENAQVDSKLTIRLSRGLNTRTLYISCRGQQIDLKAMTDWADLNPEDGFAAPEAEEHIREIILRSQSDRLSATYSKGINRVKFTIYRAPNASLRNTLVGVVAGLLAGGLVRSLCAPGLEEEISELVFSPLYELFLSAIQMVMAPLVFFSLVSSLIGLSDLSSLGRIGGKIFGFYTFTASCAAAIVYLLMTLFQPGDFGALAGAFVSDNTDVEMLSPLHQLLHIVPDSFVAPFVNTDMMQVLFIAICFGIVASMMGQSGRPICTFVESMNELFSKLMELIAKVLPFAVFGSMANMVLEMNVSNMLNLMSLAGIILLTIALMLGVYSVMLLLAGLNPIHVFRSHLDAVIVAATSFSANAAMPVAMRCCREDGISPKIYSFSIPLGSTINMDGQSIVNLSVVLFLANLCGVHIGAAAMITLIFTVLLMGMATPSAPGASLACQTMLLAMVGVPPAALALVLALNTLLEPFVVAIETVCDGVITTLVSKSEEVK